MPKFYNVTHQGKFYFEFERCTDLTKLSDHFVTEDKIKSSLSNLGSFREVYDDDLIKATIHEWAGMIKPDSSCTRLVNSDIRTMLNEIEPEVLNYLCPNTHRISGNRIYNEVTVAKKAAEKQDREAKEQERQRKIEEAKPYERKQKVYIKDRGELLECGKELIVAKYEALIFFSTTSANSVLIIKRLCTWAEVRKQIKKQLSKKEYSQDIKWIKQLWDNPERYF